MRNRVVVFVVFCSPKTSRLKSEVERQLPNKHEYVATSTCKWRNRIEPMLFEHPFGNQTKKGARLGPRDGNKKLADVTDVIFLFLGFVDGHKMVNKMVIVDIVDTCVDTTISPPRSKFILVLLWDSTITTGCVFCGFWASGTAQVRCPLSRRQQVLYEEFMQRLAVLLLKKCMRQSLHFPMNSK